MVDDMAQGPTLNLLVLRCRDMERARSFYESLGLTFSAHRHGAGPVHYACESPDFVLELYPAPADYVDRTALGFAVAELELLRDRLALAKLEPGAIEQNPWGRTFDIREPDGRRVELKQR
jgi:catechol 2,3-dioxygenase-like lactoylglutathione lyase family enzyme